MEKTIFEIQAYITILRKHSESLADLAEGQLELLKNTNATRQDYLDFREDIAGVVSIYDEEGGACK